MADFVGHPFVQALAWTLVHFLWQGAAIGIVALVLMRSSRLPWTRYAIGVGALAAMLIAPVVTLLVQLSVSIVADAEVSLASALASTAGATLPIVATDGGGALVTGVPDIMFAAIVGIWLAGVGVFGLRLAGGWLVARRVARQAVRPAAAEIQRLAVAVGERLGVRRAVTVLESTLVAVPVMVGWLKPVIVLPAAALAGLTPDQLESLLAHELAHVRRHDFLVNLLQSIVEALLFYHPAVWWISRRVRMERERCCDDVTVGVCDRLVYAEALKELAAMASPRFALAATDGDLLSRIRRVLGHADDQAGRSPRWLPIVIVAATIVLAVQASFVIAAPGVRDQTRPAPTEKEEIAVMQAVEAPQAQATQAQVERELAKRQQYDNEQVKREWDETVKRYQAAIERLQKSGEWRETVAQFEEALAKGPWQATVAQFEEALKKGQWQETVAQFEEALKQAGGQSTDRDQAAAREQALKQEIDRAARELERTRALFERGLVSQSQVAEVEAKLRTLSERLVQDAQKHELMARLGDQQHDVEKVLAVLQHQKERSAEVEKMKRMIEEHLKATMHDRAEDMEKAKRAVDEHLQANRQARESEVAMLKHGRSLAPVDGPAAAGDVLEVRIGGEPDLPTHFDIRADGTIRLPFLGSFKVVGQTAAQVQAAIGKQMSARKLGSANLVTVSVLRGR
ncbi:MAG TPA: M56 family metallopeptidase [Vicinamibacterales bacterium]|nr:M56 family metallopeptidase [Vicinamibacterales bacterium]